MDHLQGRLVAPRSRVWLSSATEPRIHSLYRQSVNLFDPQKGLLSVVLPSLGPGPFAIVATPADRSFDGFKMLEVQSRVAVQEDLLQIGDIQVNLADAREWQPRPDWARLGEALDDSQRARLKALLLEHAPSDSFAPLANVGELELDKSFQSIGLGTAADPVPDKSIQLEALRAAAEPAKLLKKCVADGKTSGAAEAAGRLAGLGGGVTPSGDDYLQGAIHALWSKVTEERAKALAEAIVSSAIPRTNAISGEWLKAAARGEAGEDWHLLEEALGSDSEVEQSVMQLIRRGHTSGADALAGFVAILPVLQ